VQVDPIKPKLTPPGTKQLTIRCDELLSIFAFKFNLRRYTEDEDDEDSEEDEDFDAEGEEGAAGEKPSECKTQ